MTYEGIQLLHNEKDENIQDQQYAFEATDREDVSIDSLEGAYHLILTHSDKPKTQTIPCADEGTAESETKTSATPSSAQ